jgi:hypothetical protein
MMILLMMIATFLASIDLTNQEGEKIRKKNLHKNQKKN